VRIFADNHQFACKIVTNNLNWDITRRSGLSSDLKHLAADLFETEHLFISELKSEKFWSNLFLVKNASVSQYDLLINKLRDKKEVPDRILCLADSGDKFHGQRNRDWVSRPGNIHLCVHLKPDKPIEHFAPGFSILAAVSVLQTIDQIDELKSLAAIKWVNDILVNDAKVCGFLTHTLSEGEKVIGAVIGIGLNVETAPIVSSTPFVQKSVSLMELTGGSNQAGQSSVFFNLIANLAENYKVLLSGGYSTLLEIYRQRSIIIGRRVTILPDPVRPDEKPEEPITGRVGGIGENLEIYLEGIDEPVTKGRLVLGD
jgi:biotin-[acetyl-CoA-carboxylase] ligase BirA-like protein